MAGLGKYDSKDTGRLLTAALAISGVLFLLKCVAGSDTVGKWVYFFVLMVVVAVNVCSLLLSRCRPGVAIQLYAWTLLVSVGAMVWFDAKTASEFPGIAIIIPTACYLLAATVGYRASLIFICASAVLIVFIGLFYGFGDSIPYIVACVACGIHAGIRRDELYSIKLAVRIITNGGK